MYPPDALDWSVDEVHRGPSGCSVKVRHIPTGKCVSAPFGADISEAQAIESSISTIRGALQRELLVG